MARSSAKTKQTQNVETAKRGTNGRWLAGGPSPNPKGRGLEAYRLGDLAKAHTPEAIATLAEVMNDKAQPGQTRINAATALMDRAFGRPSISVEAKVETMDSGSLHLAALRAWIDGTVIDGDGLKDVTPSQP